MVARARAKALVGLTLGATLTAGGDAPSLADLNTFQWASSGGVLSSGVNSNRVGLWQTLGVDQRPHCPNAALSVNGSFGAQTVTLTQRMQNDLATPTVPIPQTGIVDAPTWFLIQTAWVAAPGTPNNIQRLSALGGAQWGQSGNYEYYGGSEGYPQFAWGNSGGPIWKFKVPQTSTWYNATTSKTMGAHTVPCA